MGGEGGGGEGGGGEGGGGEGGGDGGGDGDGGGGGGDGGKGMRQARGLYSPASIELELTQVRPVGLDDS